MKSLGSLDEKMLILDNKCKNLKFNLDLWPWNDLEGESSLGGKEISPIPNKRWDVMKSDSLDEKSGSLGEKMLI